MAANDTNEDGYHPFNDDLPNVQIPRGRDRAGLTIDGEFMALYELPDDAAEAYIQYARQGGTIRVYQCETCGYLTDADALRASSYNSYTCGGCGRATASGGLQRSASGSFRQVHGPYTRPGEMKEEGYVDIQAFVSDENCPEDHGPVVPDDTPNSVRRYAEIDEAAAACDKCVPNHPSHLGRLQNQVGGEVTRDEMMQQVAEAVAAFREA